MGPDSLRARLATLYLHPVMPEPPQSSEARSDAIGTKLEGRRRHPGSHREPRALPVSAPPPPPTLCPPSGAPPAPSTRSSTLTQASGSPPPTPHACPPRAGLAPPLLVLDSLLPVLAFSPHDLTAGHVMGGSPGSGPLGQKVAKWFHPQGASGFLGAWPARRAGLLLRFLPSVVGSFPLEVSLCPQLLGVASRPIWRPAPPSGSSQPGWEREVDPLCR